MKSSKAQNPTSKSFKSNKTNAIADTFPKLESQNKVQTKIPLVALIGLPNGGKSTLINRICGFRKAITANEAGTTRDLTFGQDIWENMYFRVVDTGGMTINPDGAIAKLTQIKTLSAIAESDLLIWVIDRKQNPETISLEIIQKIWKLGKPFIVGINKVDSPNAEKDISEYAKLGGIGFVNFSAASSYGIGDLLDMMVENLEKLGFEKKTENVIEEDEITKIERKKGKIAIQKSQIVRQNKDGSYYVIRENSDKGPGLFQSMTKEMISGWEDKHKKVEIENLVFDLGGVVFHSRYEFLAQITGLDINDAEKLYFGAKFNPDTDDFWQEIIEKFNLQAAPSELNIQAKHFGKTVRQEILDFILEQKDHKQIYYLTNTTLEHLENFRKNEIIEHFRGGIGDCEIGVSKPNLEIYQHLLQKFNLEAQKTVFIDDFEKNVEAARLAGLWGIVYRAGLTELEFELGRIENAKIERIPPVPKILFLGKPNVGKSSLFNALAGADIQIITDIAGTTLSVNDTLIERTAWVKPKEKIKKAENQNPENDLYEMEEMDEPDQNLNFEDDLDDLDDE